MRGPIVIAVPTVNMMPVTKSSIGPINGAFTTNSAQLQPAWVAPRDPISSATTTTGGFQTIFQRKGMIFMGKPSPVYRLCPNGRLRPSRGQFLYLVFLARQRLAVKVE